MIFEHELGFPHPFNDSPSLFILDDNWLFKFTIEIIAFEEMVPEEPSGCWERDQLMSAIDYFPRMVWVLFSNHLWVRKIVELSTEPLGILKHCLFVLLENLILEDLGLLPHFRIILSIPCLVDAGTERVLLILIHNLFENLNNNCET